MNSKMMSLLIVAVLGLTLIPVCAEQSDADTNTVNMCSKNLCMATIQWDDKYMIPSLDRYGFNAGSENEKKMLEYIETHENPVLRDDRNNLKGEVHIYVLDYYKTSYIGIFTKDFSERITLEAKCVLDAYNNSFFVKAGDRFSFHAISAIDMYGRDANAYIDDIDYRSVDVVTDTYVEDVKKSKEIPVILYSNGGGEEYYLESYCFTVSYQASGYSEPNGSATVFIAICAIVTVLGLGLLILSSMKPKWSK